MIVDVVPTEVNSPAVEVFTFGDPVPVLDHREVLDYYQSLWMGRYYEPPISFDGLARSLTANPHHESAIRLKVSLLAAQFRPHRLLSRVDFRRLVLDYLTFGNAYLERRTSLLGTSLALKPAPARWMRVARDGAMIALIDGQEIDYASGMMLHILEPDINQEIYGLPQYLGALQSVFLNEAATLFRRRYYKNGSHAGYILYITDAAQNQEDLDNIKSELKNSRGPGNFRNLFLYSPGGKKDGLQIIPISEVAAKDDFLSIKATSRDDILAAHRVPPQLLGIIPTNAGGFGSIETAANVFYRHEVHPLTAVFAAINDWVGEEVVVFDDYVPLSAVTAAGGKG